MPSRRQFLGSIAGAGALLAAPALLLPSRRFFLPPRGGWPQSFNPYLTSKDAWFLKTEMPDGLKRYMRRCEDLSEYSLEQMCRRIRELTRDSGQVMSIKPTHFVVYGSTGR